MSPRRLVALLGLACIALGTFSLACTASTAQEQLAAQLARLADWLPPRTLALDAPAAPVPSATPIAATPPAPRHRATRTTFSINGTATVSDQVVAGGTGTSTVSNLLGVEAAFARRGERSALTASLPASLALHQGSLGNLNAAYVAPTFALFYRSESIAPFGQLGVGTLPRALGVQTRMGATDLELLTGANPADGDRTFRFVGIRAKRALGRGVAAVGVLAGRAEDGGAHTLTLLGGYATAPGRFDAVGEGALSHARGLRTAPDAALAGSFQVRANYGSPAGYASAVERYTSPSFAGVGGSGQGDRYHGLAFHRQGMTSFDLELVRQDMLGNGVTAPSTVSRAGLGLSRQLGRGSFALTASTQRQSTASGDDLARTLGLSYGFSLGGTTFVSSDLGFQQERSAQSAPLRTVRGGLGVSTTLRGGTHLQLDVASTRQQQPAGDGVGTGSQGNDTLRVGIARRYGGWSLGFTDALAHVTGIRSDAVQNAAYVTLGRRVTPTIALQAQYGLQTLRDRFDPVPRRPSTLFNLSLGAPFTLGNGDRVGHADPRLPATIAGAVVNSALSGGDVSQNGIAGITVVLDGTATRRTDFLGRFEFPFVTPGRHEVSVEAAGLPRGYTPDIPFLDVTVDGGQTAQALLGVSASAAIEGHVYGTGPDGARIPIPNVGIELDGEHRVESGPNGGFGFGRLSAGTHTVALVSSTLPADFLIPDAKRTVTTGVGGVSLVDFASSPLGSIGGTVVAPSAIGDDLRPGPLFNVYVVAEPGDHAAITDESGRFLIDNLPPGAYALSVDDETLPTNEAASSDAQRIALAGGAHVEGVRFSVTEKQRDIDFSFKGAQVTTLQVELRRRVLPPGGATTVSATSSSKVDGVRAAAFGKTFPLRAADGRHWSGMVEVPLGAPNGSADIAVTSGSLTQHAAIAVDNTVPLVGIELSPFHPRIGEYATVRAHFLAAVRPGDQIKWRDGQLTRLAQPVTGRVFRFSVKITELPFAGLLYTSGEMLPITLTGR